MNFKKHIPNIITLGNLLCGTIATIYAVEGNFIVTAQFFILGVGLDFFDGFTARLLNVQGELGKQLDSLADMVTSGVVPGIVMLQLINKAIDKDPIGYFGQEEFTEVASSLPFLGLLLTLAACYRLANFNIDERQADSFIGLPTPAMSLFVVSLSLLSNGENIVFLSKLINEPYFLIGVVLIFSYLMNAELPLFSLKFKEYSFKGNYIKYLFLIASVLLLLVLKLAAIPFIILLYVLISVLVNLFYKEKH